MEGVARDKRDKHSSLLRKFVKYGRKFFYNIGPRTQYYKAFYICNLRMLLMSQCFFSSKPFQPSQMFADQAGLGQAMALPQILEQAGKACRAKTLNLIRTIVNHGRENFYHNGPRMAECKWEKQGANTLGMMALSIMTFIIMTLGIKGLHLTLGINDTQRKQLST